MGTGHSSVSRRPTPLRPAFRSRSVRQAPAARGSAGSSAGRPGNLHTIVLTDVVMSARHDTQGQRRMRRDLYEMVRDAVGYAGLDLDSLLFTDTGDGLRLFLPVDLIRPTHVVDMFVLGLGARLREHRQRVTDAERIRMRVAFDLGVVEPHLGGWTGNPLVRVVRLIEAEPLRAALRADDRLDLVAVVSDLFYEAVVREGYGYIGPSCFRAIRVNVKEFDAGAWQLTPGTAGMCGWCYGAVA